VNRVAVFLETHMPACVRKRALWVLFRATARAFDRPAPSLVRLSADDLVLSWSPPGEISVARYVIYRDTHSDFVPAPGDSIGGTTDTTYNDIGATGVVGINYYYAVKATSDSGAKSDPSNIVGEFDVELGN